MQIERSFFFCRQTPKQNWQTINYSKANERMRNWMSIIWMASVFSWCRQFVFMHCTESIGFYLRPHTIILWIMIEIFDYGTRTLELMKIEEDANETKWNGGKNTPHRAVYIHHWIWVRPPAHIVYISSIKHSLNYSRLRCSSSSNNSYCWKIAWMYGNMACTLHDPNKLFFANYFKHIKHTPHLAWMLGKFNARAFCHIHIVGNSIERIEGNVSKLKGIQRNSETILVHAMTWMY